MNKPLSNITLVICILTTPFIALATSWVGGGFTEFEDLAAFFFVTMICIICILLTWRSLQSENPPRRLFTLVWVALFLRLFAGVLWFTGLPKWGHNTPAEQSGYVMADAYERDQTAWKLSQSNKALWSVFQEHKRVDQYGGLLFISAFLYRYVSTDTHQPLLMIIITASLGGLAILFIWALAKHAWNEKIAWYAAFGLSLYPDAILLGSSQMREAFTIPLVALTFYGLMRLRNQRVWRNLIIVLVPLLLILPISPPTSALTFVLLIISAALLLLRETHTKRGKLAPGLVIGLVLVLILVGLWISLQRYSPEKINNPFEMVVWWLRKTSLFQAFLSERASGWMQAIFDATPEWLHLPLLVVYGILQPFLPAAIVVGSQAPIWRWISLWRAAGWTILLLLLLASPLLAWRKKERVAATLSIVSWFSLLIASLRGGADMWDNPRYRTAFVAIQIPLAAWVWLTQRQKPDSWLRRFILGFLTILCWFIPWYMRRYLGFPWGVYEFSKVIGAGIISATLLIVWDLAKSFSPPSEVMINNT